MKLLCCPNKAKKADALGSPGLAYRKTPKLRLQLFYWDGTASLLQTLVFFDSKAFVPIFLHVYFKILGPRF